MNMWKMELGKIYFTNRDNELPKKIRELSKESAIVNIIRNKIGFFIME